MSNDPQDWRAVLDGRREWAIVRGDCTGLLAELPAGSVDAVITDPPYGVDAAKAGKTFGTSNACAVNAYSPIIGDSEPFDPAPLLSRADTVCLWGANHYSDKLPARARWLIWDKRDGTNPNPLADCEMAWTSDTRPARLFHHRWMGMIRASEARSRWHPAQKPVMLFEWCIETLQIPEAAIILDPYAGSGSCGVAAIQQGRRYIGCEISAEYHAIAVDRLTRAAASRQLTMPLAELTA